jgi:hypothetical protein
MIRAASIVSPAALAGVIAALALPACGGESTPDAPEAQSCPIGDMSAAPEVEIMHLDAQSAVVQTQAMAQVPLIPPPQGGWIVLLGAKARNIDGCRLNLKTVLVDTCNNEIIGLDSRPTKLVVGSDGWGVSSVTMFGNLAVCPQQTATRDLHDAPYKVQVILDDDDGKKGQAEMMIVPVCPANMPLCTCQCGRDYKLGTDCPSTAPAPHPSCP